MTKYGVIINNIEIKDAIKSRTEAEVLAGNCIMWLLNENEITTLNDAETHYPEAKIVEEIS